MTTTKILSIALSIAAMLAWSFTAGAMATDHPWIAIECLTLSLTHAL